MTNFEADCFEISTSYYKMPKLQAHTHVLDTMLPERDWNEAGDLFPKSTNNHNADWLDGW